MCLQSKDPATLFVSRIPQGIYRLHAKKNRLFYDEILDRESQDFVVNAIGIRVNEFLAKQCNDIENREKLFAEYVGKRFNVNHSHYYLFKIPFS